MIRHRYIDRICGGAILLALVLTGLLCFGEALGLRPASAAPEYASRLFDDSRVHTVDLRVEDWAGFLENAPAEEYIPCTVVIDGEEFYTMWTGATTMAWTSSPWTPPFRTTVISKRTWSTT